MKVLKLPVFLPVSCTANLLSSWLFSSLISLRSTFRSNCGGQRMKGGGGRRVFTGKCTGTWQLQAPSFTPYERLNIKTSRLRLNGRPSQA